jgi:2-polyprenyl-6-methoxyphenol hydroxylase and related FAD-dependent oxidoreductases
MLVAGDDPDEMTRPERIWQLLQPWLAGSDGELIRNTVYRFQSKLAEQFGAGTVWLAGDAAHLMPPFLGQGMCSGIRDAATLAWQLDLVLRGVARVESLADYGAARRPHVRSYIRESMRVGGIVCETDPLVAARNLAAMTSVSAVPPPFQPPIGAGFRAGDPLAGELAVQPCVRSDDGRLMRLDDRLGCGFQLLTTVPVPPDAAALVTEIGNHLPLSHAVIGDGPDADFGDEDGSFRKWLAAAGVDAVLVRPDFYVYGSAEAHEVTALLRSLQPALQLS